MTLLEIIKSELNNPEIFLPRQAIQFLRPQNDNWRGHPLENFLYKLIALNNGD